MAALEFGDLTHPVDLIFLHANGFNALTYRAILEPLATGAHILALDLRGHGRSTLATTTQDRHSWMDFRDDLLAFLRALDITDAVVVGHSMGGAVSVFVAAEAPGRIRRLVLFDPVMIPRVSRSIVDTPSPLVAGAARRRAVFPNREAALEAYRGRNAFKTWSPEMLGDYVIDGFLDLPTGEVALACRPEWESSNFAALDQDAWEAAARTLCPIAILRADIESTCRIDGDVEALTNGGRISVETIAGASHFLPMERPELCRDALMAALEA